MKTKHQEFMKENPYCDESMFKGAKPDTFKRAEILRSKMTSSELKLWEILKNKNNIGHRFRRQHPLGYYILDFYNHQLKLCIEVDGKYHETKDQQVKDKLRDEFLKFNQIKVLRFSNEEVENDFENVIGTIKKIIAKKKLMKIKI